MTLPHRPRAGLRRTVGAHAVGAGLALATVAATIPAAAIPASAAATSTASAGPRSAAATSTADSSTADSSTAGSSTAGSTTASTAGSSAGSSGAAAAAQRMPAADDLAPDLAVGDTAFVDVAVATLWSAPGLERAIDAPALFNPVDLRRWNLNLQHTTDREWLSAGSKLETQALYGAPVEVTARDGAWAKVVVAGQPTPRDARGYPGWVPARQLVESPRFAEQLTDRRLAVVTSTTAWLTRRHAAPDATNRTTELSFTTTLPVVGSRPGRIGVALPDGGRGWLDAADVTIRRQGERPPAPTGQDIVDTGSRFLGLRYLWAGVSGFGFDCSGFTHTVFAAHGVTIPRDSGPQSRGGTPVERADLRPGDLVFFAGPGGVGRVHHVAIYAGDGRILHSPNSSRNVEIVALDHFDADKEYAGARRYL